MSLKSVNRSAGAHIRMQRVERGLSLREAAGKLGLTHVEMGEVERNMRGLTIEQETQWKRVLAAFPPKEAGADAYLAGILARCAAVSETPAPAARDVAHGPFTLLDLDAYPVGGWWPDDVGDTLVRTEGPVHPRVGTVVRAEDIETLPTGTLADRHRVLVTRHSDFGWCICDSGLVPAYDANVIGATILYVPLEKP